MKNTLHYLSGRILFQYIFPLTLFTFALITEKFQVNTDGGYSLMYGFPFPYITEAWATSFHHSLYIVPMLADLFIYLLVITGLVVSVQSAGVVLRSHWFSLILVWLAVGVLYAFEFLLLADYNSYTLFYDTTFVTTGTMLEAGPYPTN